jgi:uncharacterized repeat protein (TIGR03806 family)
MTTRSFIVVLWLATGICACGDGARPDQAPPDAREADARPAAQRPSNPGCKPPASVPEIGSEGLPARLSDTGCFDPSDPTRPLAGLIPYEVNAPLWSDGATKQRWIALPDGARIHVNADGDLDLPPGTVTIKTFSLGGRRIETRFFVRLLSGEWSGYTYEWDEGGSNASVLPEGSRRRMIGDRQWHYPTRAECLTCHTQAAGRTLGLELGQLNREVALEGLPPGNQLAAWASLDLFDTSLPAEPPARLPVLPAPADARLAVDQRARAYLHANCSICHRPGVELTGRTDFRFSTPLAAMMTCNAEPRDLLKAPADARILVPGDPDRSMIVVRMRELGRGRMPEVGSLSVDAEGVALVSDWIRALSACPP